MGRSNHGYVLVGGYFVEAGGEDAVVFQIARCVEEAGCDAAFRVAEDGLENLDLIGVRDLGVVRFVLQRIGIVVIADDGTVGIECAGLEDGAARVVFHGDVKPDATGRVSGGKLVAGKVLDLYDK